MSLTVRNWPFAARLGLWLTWWLVLSVAAIFFYKDQEALLHPPEPKPALFLFLLCIASGTGLWLLLRLDKRDTVAASVAAGLVATLFTLFVGMPAVYLAISLVAAAVAMVTP